MSTSTISIFSVPHDIKRKEMIRGDPNKRCQEINIHGKQCNRYGICPYHPIQKSIEMEKSNLPLTGVKRSLSEDSLFDESPEPPLKTKKLQTEDTNDNNNIVECPIDKTKNNTTPFQIDKNGNDNDKSIENQTEKTIRTQDFHSNAIIKMDLEKWTEVLNELREACIENVSVLKTYKPFSSQTYGELEPILVEEVIKRFHIYLF